MYIVHILTVDLHSFDLHSFQGGG